MLCLWPLVLGLAAPGAYARWRELLIPAHLAAQHWIGLRFSMPLESHHRMVGAGRLAGGGAGAAHTASAGISLAGAGWVLLWRPRAEARCGSRRSMPAPSVARNAATTRRNRAARWLPPSPCRPRQSGSAACCQCSWLVFASRGSTWCAFGARSGAAQLGPASVARLAVLVCCRRTYVCASYGRSASLQEQAPTVLASWPAAPDRPCWPPAVSSVQAFGACLLRTRLRTFLWTQPLLLAPMLWTGGSHCASQLGTTPEAATHLRRIAAAMQRGSSWLPVGPLLGSLRSGGAAAATAPSSPQAACLAVHLWLVLVLSFCLPAIVIHRLEGQEEEEGEEDARKRLQHGGGGTAGAPRQLLHQQPPPLLHSAAELLLAGYAAWLFVQVVLMLTGQ